MAEKKEIERGELPAAEFEFVLTKSDQQDLKDQKIFAAVAKIIIIILELQLLTIFVHINGSADGAVFDLAKLLII